VCGARDGRQLSPHSLLRRVSSLAHQFYQDRVRARCEYCAVAEVPEFSIPPTVRSAGGGNTTARERVRPGRDAGEAYSSVDWARSVAIASDRAAGLTVIILAPAFHDASVLSAHVSGTERDLRVGLSTSSAYRGVRRVRGSGPVAEASIV